MSSALLLVFVCALSTLNAQALAQSPPPYSLINVPGALDKDPPRPPPASISPPRPPPYPTEYDNITCFYSDFPFAAGSVGVPQYGPIPQYNKCFAFHFSVTLKVESTTFYGTNTYYGGQYTHDNLTCEQLIDEYTAITVAVSPPGYSYAIIPDMYCCDTWACNSVDNFPNTATFPSSGSSSSRASHAPWPLLVALLGAALLFAMDSM